MEDEEEEAMKMKTQRREIPAVSPSVKRPRVPEMEDDVMSWLSSDDMGCNSEADLLKLLESTTDVSLSACSMATRVRFIDNPYSSTFVFQSSSSYITINCYEESCGSSFSDSDSSMMASVDMRGIVWANANGPRGDGWPGWGKDGASCASKAEVRGWMMEEEEEGGGKGTEGCDDFGRDREWDWDDDELTRFLGEELFCSKC